MCIIQDSFTDCSGVGTSQRDNPADANLFVCKGSDGLSYTYPWHRWWGRRVSENSKPLVALWRGCRLRYLGRSHIDLRGFRKDEKKKKKTRRRTSCSMRRKGEGK